MAYKASDIYNKTTESRKLKNATIPIIKSNVIKNPINYEAINSRKLHMNIETYNESSKNSLAPTVKYLNVRIRNILMNAMNNKITKGKNKICKKNETQMCTPTNPMNQPENPRALREGIKGWPGEKFVQSSSNHSGVSTSTYLTQCSYKIANIDPKDDTSSEGSFQRQFSEWLKTNKCSSDASAAINSARAKKRAATMDSENSERQPRKKERTSPRFKKDSKSMVEAKVPDAGARSRDTST